MNSRWKKHVIPFNADCRQKPIRKPDNADQANQKRETDNRQSGKDESCLDTAKGPIGQPQDR